MLATSDTGSGTPILWLHPFPLSSAIYEPQLAIGGVRHLMPDLPGFGDTEPPQGELDMDDYARAALGVLDARGIDRAVVAGLSMGGYIAFALARLAPERLRGLILIDTRETPDTDEARKGRFATIEKVREEGVSVVVEAMFPKMLTAAAPQAMKERVRAIMSASSKEGVIAALRAMANRRDSTPLLADLEVPALVVVGEEDTITPPSDSERMARGLPKATLVRLANAAHLSSYEQAEAFNDAVQKYLK